MVRFDPEYPFKSPAVQFVVSDKVKPPMHPVRPSYAQATSAPNSRREPHLKHVYTNGHVCAIHSNTGIRLTRRDDGFSDMCFHSW
jgi:hypothetical protein